MRILRKPLLHLALLQHISPTKIFEFTHLLESEDPARGKGSLGDFSFTVGSFVHGGNYGPRTSSTEFPLTTQVFARFFRQQCPEAIFTNLVLLKDIQTKTHIDPNNSLPCLNTVVKVTDLNQEISGCTPTKAMNPAPTKSWGILGERGYGSKMASSGSTHNCDTVLIRGR